MRKPYLQDKRVRQAMLYAIDNEQFLKTVWGGVGKVSDAPFQYGTSGISPTMRKYSYDSEKAKELLKEANWDPNRKWS